MVLTSWWCGVVDGGADSKRYVVSWIRDEQNTKSSYASTKYTALPPPPLHRNAPFAVSYLTSCSHVLMRLLSVLQENLTAARRARRIKYGLKDKLQSVSKQLDSTIRKERVLKSTVCCKPASQCFGCRL